MPGCSILLNMEQGVELILQGRRITASEIEIVKKLIGANPSWNRTRLSKELCALCILLACPLSFLPFLLSHDTCRLDTTSTYLLIFSFAASNTSINSFANSTASGILKIEK